MLCSPPPAAAGEIGMIRPSTFGTNSSRPISPTVTGRPAVTSAPFAAKWAGSGSLNKLPSENPELPRVKSP